MNVEGGGVARCVRHPSQFFTGFCSSCLVERLSNVDAVERSPEPSTAPQGEIAEISSSSSSAAVALDSQGKGGEVRVRRTLLSLFQLDDCSDAGIESSESSAVHLESKVDSLEDRALKEKNLSFWSGSGLRWRSRGASKSGRFSSKRDLGHSCDWRVCHESHEPHDSGRWEKPRHSWDGGSVMSKALSCSFACLEEPHDGSSRIRRRAPEENGVSDSERCQGATDVSKADNVSSVDEKPSSPHSSLGSLFRERRHHEEFHQEMYAMDVNRKKSHRWSRVWDWSLTSPFRDLSKKREHAMERSLSGTWQDREKSESQCGVSAYGNGQHAFRTNQCLNRNVSNREIQKFRPDWQRKRDYRFGRSRSVHYPSPGNVDNGLLRFYLTPMRTSRRTSNNRRMRSSHFLMKGILGH